MRTLGLNYRWLDEICFICNSLRKIRITFNIVKKGNGKSSWLAHFNSPAKGCKLHLAHGRCIWYYQKVWSYLILHDLLKACFVIALMLSWHIMMNFYEPSQHCLWCYTILFPCHNIIAFTIDRASSWRMAHLWARMNKWQQLYVQATLHLLFLW